MRLYPVAESASPFLCPPVLDPLPCGILSLSHDAPHLPLPPLNSQVVQLYANGELISTIDLKGSPLADAKRPGGGQGLWLPRMTIGATDRALHGYIQEVLS